MAEITKDHEGTAIVYLSTQTAETAQPSVAPAVSQKNYITQITAADGKNYDLATHHTVTFYDGQSSSADYKIWNGLEDIEVKIPNISDLIQNPLAFAGTISPNEESASGESAISWIKTGHTKTAGDVVFVLSNGLVSFEGFSGHVEAGDMCVYDGSKWHIVSGENQIIVNDKAKTDGVFYITSASKLVLTVEGNEVALALDNTDILATVASNMGVEKGEVTGTATVTAATVYLNKTEDTATVAKGGEYTVTGSIDNPTVTIKASEVGYKVVTDVTTSMDSVSVGITGDVTLTAGEGSDFVAAVAGSTTAKFAKAGLSDAQLTETSISTNICVVKAQGTLNPDATNFVTGVTVAASGTAADISVYKETYSVVDAESATDGEFLKSVAADVVLTAISKAELLTSETTGIEVVNAAPTFVQDSTLFATGVVSANDDDKEFVVKEYALLNSSKAATEVLASITVEGVSDALGSATLSSNATAATGDIKYVYGLNSVSAVTALSLYCVDSEKAYETGSALTSTSVSNHVLSFGTMKLGVTTTDVSNAVETAYLHFSTTDAVSANLVTDYDYASLSVTTSYYKLSKQKIADTWTAGSTTKLFLNTVAASKESMGATATYGKLSASENVTGYKFNKQAVNITLNTPTYTYLTVALTDAETADALTDITFNSGKYTASLDADGIIDANKVVTAVTPVSASIAGSLPSAGISGNVTVGTMSIAQNSYALANASANVDAGSVTVGASGDMSVTIASSKVVTNIRIDTADGNAPQTGSSIQTIIVS